MLDIESDLELKYKGWKKCPSCGWCCDKEGYNLVDKKENANEQKSLKVDKSKY